MVFPGVRLEVGGGEECQDFRHGGVLELDHTQEGSEHSHQSLLSGALLRQHLVDESAVTLTLHQLHHGRLRFRRAQRWELFHWVLRHHLRHTITIIIWTLLKTNHLHV